MEILIAVAAIFVAIMLFGAASKNKRHPKRRGSGYRPVASRPKTNRPSNSPTTIRPDMGSGNRFGANSTKCQNLPRFPDGMRLTGKAYIIDGDTIVVQKTKIRLAGIDAPELNMPWGQKSKWAMVDICKGQTITVELDGERSFDRLVGTCFLPDGRDIGAELIKRGLALDLPHFSRGKYKHLEPEGARRMLCNGRFGHASIRRVQHTQIRIQTFQK